MHNYTHLLTKSMQFFISGEVIEEKIPIQGPESDCKCAGSGQRASLCDPFHAGPSAALTLVVPLSNRSAPSSVSQRHSGKSGGEKRLTNSPLFSRHLFQTQINSRGHTALCKDPIGCELFVHYGTHLTPTQ